MFVDPISNLVTAANIMEDKGMLTRLIDYLKGKQITALCTDLTTAGGDLEQTEVGVSSLMDTWLLAIEEKGERNRGLNIVDRLAVSGRFSASAPRALPPAIHPVR